jgi:hypothetical protein
VISIVFLHLFSSTVVNLLRISDIIHLLTETDHHSEHVINTHNNTSAEEGLQDLHAHFQLFDKSFSERMTRITRRIDDSFAKINR